MVGVLGPGKWLAAVVVCIDEGVDGIGQFPDRAEGAPADGLASDDAEENFVG
jgi:hypothetical protein